ncbi:ATP adenylyltransferase domain-containing protein [Hirsutella rhossiliensis]|uniref:ATP adenylyltransferase domain-containing protein n=1 Tax=Hirsutella rhossiliensis TaxID=111463 RepID=A0A9P8N319_9HYPO|nr:ATP adenylyltransferase domain-containing protein [Hirsutella rhossiliensis]KAH0966002.1 ATP adenylyltransferase domain-containing protein [Hirsutella rhossiliensis]
MSRAAIKAPAQLPELVRAAFAKARTEGEVQYFPTKVTLLSVGSIPFQLRFSPALANKPQRAGHAPREQPVDPFAYPPRRLFVADLGPSHYLVLNKFAVVPEHFILATREFRPQTGVLDEADLEATLACIRAYRDSREDGDGLFAFFNGGEHSGASQPHRHIQLLPVARMREGLDDGASWSLLATSPHLDKAPFATFSEKISQSTSPRHLHAAYLRLYRQACHAATGTALPAGDEGEGEARISYNLAMTEDTLVVCPRRAEGGEVRRPAEGGGGEVVGRLALNGTVLAGTALVRKQEEWDALREDPGGLVRVLGRIGVPRGE